MQHHTGGDGKLDNSVQEVTTYILDKALPPVVHKEMSLPRGIFGSVIPPRTASVATDTEVPGSIPGATRFSE